MNPSRASTEAFTRTDLVASLAVISVLALLAPPLFGSGLQHGEAAFCLENLRRLTSGWMMYANDYQGFMPPNPDTGTSDPGMTWVPGNAGAGPNEFDTAILADTSRSLLYLYSGQDVRVFRCPSDTRRGLFRPPNGPPVPDSPAARSVAANLAVGVDPYVAGGKTATDAYWLDNNHGNRANLPWRTYGKFDDMVAPSPAGLFLLIDEDEISINNCFLTMGMARAEWIDWPGTRHDMGAGVSFADGHTELHRWKDQSTVVKNGNVSRRYAPGSEDYTWLSQRTSARAQ